MVNTSMLEKSAPLFVIVKQWTAEFKHGRTNVENDLCSKRSKSVSTLEIIKKKYGIRGQAIEIM